MSRSWRHGERNKRKLYGDWYHWYTQEPKWWRKLMKHKKRRAAVRACRHQVMVGNLDVLWPLNVKPWIYYW